MEPSKKSGISERKIQIRLPRECQHRVPKRIVLRYGHLSIELVKIIFFLTSGRTGRHRNLRERKFRFRNAMPSEVLFLTSKAMAAIVRANFSNDTPPQGKAFLAFRKIQLHCFMNLLSEKHRTSSKFVTLVERSP